MPKKILLAGATGRLGSHLLPKLKENGYFVRGLSRFPQRISPVPICDDLLAANLCQPQSLHGCCKGIDIVFSAAGASLDPNAIGDRAPYHTVDYLGNLNLLREAIEAGVKRFVFVSVFGGQSHRHLAYCDAHERFVDELKKSDISFCVIRPTGFFSVFKQMYAMAAKGFAITIGNGSCRTNPIHEEDLASICLDALVSEETAIDVGGPQIITRKEIVTLAFEALGKKERVVAVSPFLFKTAAAGIAFVQPRISELLKFGVEVSMEDTIAPAFGTHRLIDYYRQLAISEGREGDWVTG